MFFINALLPTLKFKILAIFYFRRKRAELILFSSWLLRAWDHWHGLFPRKVSSCLIWFGDFCLVFRILLRHVILCEAVHDLLPDKIYLPFLCIFWNFIYFCSCLYQNEVLFFKLSTFSPNVVSSSVLNCFRFISLFFIPWYIKVKQ